MAEHLVDVVIPAFNAADTLRDSIASIQAQTIAKVRILCVDDGSTDETPRILAEIAATDPRVEVLTRRNGGIVEARNAGLARCRAPFVACLDADDLAAPDRLERQIAYLEAHPDCVAVSGTVRHVDAVGRPLGTVSRLAPPDAADPLRAPAAEPYLVHPFMTARLAAVREAGGYRHVELAEDTDLYWRMQERGRLHNMDEVMGDYRLHSSSVSAASIANGRLMALSSQLAAISAQRRRAGRPDLDFPKEVVGRHRAAAATSLSELYALGREGLTAPEAAHLEIALAGKLLELAAYRPYELDLGDCRFVRAALDRHMAGLGAENRALLVRMCAGTAARLLHKGMAREAMALVPPALYPAMLARLAFRTLVPSGLDRRLRAAIGRSPSVPIR